MKKFFPFTRRKGSSETRIKGSGGGGGGGSEGGTRTGRHDVNRHSIGSYSSVSNRSMVIQLIRGAYNIDLAKVDQSFTKLHKSCFLNQDLNKIRKYLKQGANPNQLDNVSRSSPLHLATVNGNLNVIRLLIENGGNIDLTDGDGKTLAIKAVECFHKECLQFLILQGANLNVGDNLVGNTVLHWSIVNNFPDGLRLCLAYSGRIDVNHKNKSGESALHLLVKYPDLFNYIGDLLDNGAEIDLRNNLQQTPLMVACEHGHIEAARTLINRGSYIYHQDESGFTALGIAKRNGHLILAQYLTDLGGFDQPTRRESQIIRDEVKTTAIDSWPSTEEEDEDEDEIAAKTRKFNPIIQQLKSLQGGRGDLTVGENIQQNPTKLLQSSELNQQRQQQRRESWIKSSSSDQQSTLISTSYQQKLSLGQKSNYEMNHEEGQTMASNTRTRDDDDDDDNKVMTRSKLNNSMKISNGDNNVTSESRSSVKMIDSRETVPTDFTSLDHIDSVYSHETANDEFIREIKNLLDEEIRENDELDALLFSTSFNTPGKVTTTTTSLINSVDDGQQEEDDHLTYQQDNPQLTSKIVNKLDSSEQQSSALRKLSASSTQLASSTNILNSKSTSSSSSSTTTTTDHLKAGPSETKNIIHVDILSDLWEDWEGENKSDEEDGKKISSSSVPIKATTSNRFTKDPPPPPPPPPPLPPSSSSIPSNGQEILGTFFLNNISDEDESSGEVDSPIKVKDEDNDDDGTMKDQVKEQVKKDEKSSEAEEDKMKRNLVMMVNKKNKKKEEEDKSSSFILPSTLSTHQPETFSSSLTPILRSEAISSSPSSSSSSSMDKKSNVSANLIPSQSSSSPPLPPPPVTFTPPASSPPLPLVLPPPPPLPSTTTTTSSSLPPALPPRPSNRITIDTLKDKSIELQRRSIEVQTELDQLEPRLLQLKQLEMENENRIKTLENQLNKQSRESDEHCKQLRMEINCLDRDRKSLESQLIEMRVNQEKLILEKAQLTSSEAKLRRQLDSYEECKCSQLKEELKQVKETIKSRRNHNNDEFIRKLHDLNDECNDLRRELTAEQSSLKEEINQLEKDKEMFKLENQWLKEKLDEMRIQMRKHFLLSSESKPSTDQHHHHHDDDHHQMIESNERSTEIKRKQIKEKQEENDNEDKDDDDDDQYHHHHHPSVNDRIETETIEEMRKTMVTVESLLRKLDEKISSLNLEEQKKLMEKIIGEIAKVQINLQVETVFQGIRSLLEDLHRQLISFQLTIEENKQQFNFNNNQKVQQQLDDGNDDKSSFEKVNRDDGEHDESNYDLKPKQLKDDSSNCSPTTKKIIANGFSIFESRISQLTSSIEKLEDNIERQELNMLIQARGSIWSTSIDQQQMDTGHYHQSDVNNNNSLLINLINSTDYRRKIQQSTQRKPQSVFVQSLMRLQSTPVDSKTNYLKLINQTTNGNNNNNNYFNYEPSIVGDFNYTKNNLSKQIDHLKSELGLSR